MHKFAPQHVHLCLLLPARRGALAVKHSRMDNCFMSQKKTISLLGPLKNTGLNSLLPLEMLPWRKSLGHIVEDRKCSGEGKAAYKGAASTVGSWSLIPLGRWAVSQCTPLLRVSTQGRQGTCTPSSISHWLRGAPGSHRPSGSSSLSRAGSSGHRNHKCQQVGIRFACTAVGRRAGH